MHVFNPSTPEEARGRKVSEFEACLVHTVSSRQLRIHSETLSQAK